MKNKTKYPTDAGGAAADEPCRPALTLDVQLYEKYLEDAEMSEEEKKRVSGSALVDHRQLCRSGLWRASASAGLWRNDKSESGESEDVIKFSKQISRGNNLNVAEGEENPCVKGR